MTSKFCSSFTKIKNKYISLKRFPVLFKKKNYFETSARYVYGTVIFLSISEPGIVDLKHMESLNFQS